MNNNHNQEPPPAGPPPRNNNVPPPMARPNGQAPRSMEELCQPSINERGGPIASIPIQATNFGLRHHMIQQVQNTCQFHRLPGDDANRHIDKFLEITQHMKQNRVSDDALRLSLFPYSLTHHAIAWYDLLPRNSIHLFDDMMRKFLSKYFPPSMVTKLRNEITKFEQKPYESLFKAWERGTFMQKIPEECYELIENITAHHNHWDTLAIRDETSRNISSTSTTESLEVIRQLEMMNKNSLEMMRQFQTVKTVDTKCETCGGPHSFTECPAVGGYTQETAYATTDDEPVVSPKMIITTRSGVSYDGPPIHPPTSSFPKVVERVPEVTKDTYDTEGDILYLENLLNEDPSSNLPLVKTEDLKQVDPTMTRPSIEEPPELELKELSSHLEYISIDPQDQEKTTFTCPYGTFADRRRPFGLCNAPGTFRRCMMAIFHDMIEKTIDVFMDDFSVFGDSFSSCLSYLDQMLKRRKDTNLVLNWEKCHFMVKDGIVLSHKISKSRIEVDRAKVDVIAKLPHRLSSKVFEVF
nr:reverse transcriptase domain-containing protein [Tanacetum cinerariifolium]